MQVESALLNDSEICLSPSSDIGTSIDYKAIRTQRGSAVALAEEPRDALY